MLAMEFIPPLLILGDVPKEIRCVEGLHAREILEVRPHHVAQPGQGVKISRRLRVGRDALSSTHQEITEALVDEVFGLHDSHHEHVGDDMSVIFKNCHRYLLKQLLGVGPPQEVDPFLD